MVKAGSFQGNSVSKLVPEDIRFTRDKANNLVYLIAMGWPTEPMIVGALGTSASTHPGKGARVGLLGTGERVSWKQHWDGLRVELPKHFQPKVDYAVVLNVTLASLAGS